MDSPKMVALGLKRKDLESSGCIPCSSKDEEKYEEQIVYPSLDARNEQAEILGVETLEVGEYVKQTVIWKVDRVSKSEENGKKTFGLCLAMVEASDMEKVTKPDSAPADKKTGSDDASPALEFIKSKAAY